MNTRVVKSFGLALLVAVGILALLLALGTFNAPKAGADVNDPVEDANNVTTTPAAPGPGAKIGMTLEFQLDSPASRFDEITISLEDFGVPASIEEKSVSVRQGDNGDAAAAVDVDGTDIVIELPDINDDDSGLGILGSTDTTIVIRKNAGITAPTTTGNYPVMMSHDDQETAVQVGTVDISRILTVDPGKGGSGTEITVSGKALANGTGSLYTETLTNPDANNDGIVDTLITGDDSTDNPTENNNNDWGLNVDGDDDAEYDLLRVPAVTADPGATPPVEAAPEYYVAVTMGATQVVATEDDTNNVLKLGYTISSALAPAGTPTMPGATYEGEKSLKDVAVSLGAFSTMIDAEDLKFGGSQNMSYVRIVDADGDETRASFQVTGTMILGSDSIGKGHILKISLADWIDSIPDEVKIGGVPVAQKDSDTEGDQSTFVDKDGKTVDAPAMGDLDEGALDFYVKVSGKVGLGTKSVVLFEDGSALEGARDSLEITASDLTVSPLTAVVGQEVTITGSGFTGDVNEIKIGGVAVCEGTGDDACDIEVASGGRVVAAFNIPNEADLADAGDYTIMVTDSGSRIGSGTVTIPERTLTVDPAESRINTTINLSGTGWPTGTGANLVAIYYDTIQYASATSGSGGTWSASISVPDAAGVGRTHKVEAKATVGDDEDNVTMEEDHATPDAVVTLSSGQAQRGTTITVSGANFNVFHMVTIEIDGSSVTPSPAPTTDADGSFSTQVLVPGLSLGNKNLKVTVKDVPVVEFLEIIAAPVAPVSADPADVFADLIEAGTLVEVLQLVRTSDTDITWLFYKPGEMFEDFNTYSESESGDILFVNVSSQTTFQGKTLYTGWNQHVLD